MPHDGGGDSQQKQQQSILREEEQRQIQLYRQMKEQEQTMMMMMRDAASNVSHVNSKVHSKLLRSGRSQAPSFMVSPLHYNFLMQSDEQ